MSRFNSNHPALVVGQEVVLCRSGSWETHYRFGYKVAKVTASGQFTIQLNADGQDATRVRRFTKDGDEIGAGDHFRVWIDTDVEGLRNMVATKEARANAVQLLHGVTTYEKVGKDASKEFLLATAARMRAALDAADAAIALLPN